MSIEASLPRLLAVFGVSCSVFGAHFDSVRIRRKKDEPGVSPSHDSCRHTHRRCNQRRHPSPVKAQPLPENPQREGKDPVTNNGRK